MVLGVDVLLQLVEEKKLVEGLSDRELKNPEGVGFDIRVGKLLRLKGKGFLGVTERDTPDVELIAEYDPKKKKSHTIQPGEYYLTESVEKFNMPLDLVSIVKPRTTLHRSGIITRVSIIDPGYSGTIHPAIYNAGNVPVEIELGARYVNAMFYRIEGDAACYRGQWQGGRLTTDGRETQV